MKKIEQPWEERNLGVKSVEFFFELKDDTGCIEKEVLSDTVHDYIQCRVPAGKMDIAYELQKKGFMFSEASLDLSADLKELQLPAVYRKYIQELSYAKVEDAAYIYEKIKSGIFDTDRISLDRSFRPGQSGVRFANWCRQEVEAKTARCYMVSCEEKEIGFFALKNHSDREANSLLAGLYEKENNMGWGFSVLYYPMLQAKKEGKKRIVTTVSSNNPDSLKLHLKLGYEIKQINYVLIKHI